MIETHHIMLAKVANCPRRHFVDLGLCYNTSLCTKKNLNSCFHIYSSVNKASYSRTSEKSKLIQTCQNVYLLSCTEGGLVKTRLLKLDPAIVLN